MGCWTTGRYNPSLLHHISRPGRFLPLSLTQLHLGPQEPVPSLTAPAAPPPSSLGSIALVTGLTFIQLLVQFAMQVVLAKYFGAASEMDAYVAALAPPVVIATILSGSIGYVLIPVVAEQLKAAGSRAAAAVASQVGLYLLLIAGFIALVVALCGESISRLLCPGFMPEQQALTAKLVCISSILIVANCLITYLNALSHCYGQFARPALAGVSGTLVTLVYVILLHNQQGIFAVAWSVVLGAAVTGGLLLPLFIEKGREASVWKLPLLESTRRCIGLLAPIVLAALYWRLDPLLDRYLSSRLATGSTAHLGYAWRLTAALSLIGTSGLSIVAFPTLAAYVAAGERDKVCAELARAIRLMLFLSVPVCVGLIAFAMPVVRLLFERGRFNAADTQQVSLLVVLYVGVVLGTGLGDLLSRTFYALQDMWVPAMINVAVFTLAAAMKILVVSSYGVAGLVFATSFYYLASAGLLAAVLERRLSSEMLAGTSAEFNRSLASSIFACAVATAIIRLPLPAAVVPAAICGAIMYVLAMWLMDDEFAAKLVRRAFRPRQTN
jgi:putative peptidoglycan lipid II flippase